MNLLDNGFNLILVYMIAGLAGNLWETLLHLVRDKKFVYSNGSIFTPFNFVYGFGGVCIVLALFKLINYPYLVFLVGGLLGGFIEYMLSFLEEKICKFKSWDYTGRILNIKGRTTVPIMFFWGLMCVIVLYVIYIPFVLYVINKFFINNDLNIFIYHTIMWISLSYCVFDLIMVTLLMIRSQRRKRNLKPLTFIGVFLDKFFPEKYVSKHFPNSDSAKEVINK